MLFVDVFISPGCYKILKNPSDIGFHGPVLCWSCSPRTAGIYAIGDVRGPGEVTSLHGLPRSDCIEVTALYGSDFIHLFQGLSRLPVQLSLFFIGYI